MTTHFPNHPTLCQFLKMLKFSLCCPPVLECVACASSLGDPTKTTLLKKINSPSSSSYHLSVTLPLGEDLMPATPLCAGMLSDLSLHSSCAPLNKHCECVCAAALLCLENIFLVAIHCCWLLHSLVPLFHNNLWALEEGRVCYRCSI